MSKREFIEKYWSKSSQKSNSLDFKMPKKFIYYSRTTRVKKSIL